MYRWIVMGICLIRACFLFSSSQNDLEPMEVANTEGLPSNLVNESVCVISGEFSDSILDVVIPGPEPLVIQRHYSNMSKSRITNYWSFNHFDTLVLGYATYDEKPVWIMALCQPSGAQLDYIHERSEEAKKKKKLSFDLITPKGLTNGANSLSGRTNLKNQEVHFYPDQKKVVAISGGGNRREFKKIGRTEEGWNICGQQNEEKVNGSVYHYKPIDKACMGLSQVICQNGKTGQLYSSAQIKPLKKESHPVDPIFQLTTSDGRHLTYYFTTHKFKEKIKTPGHESSTPFTQQYLTAVNHPYAPAESYEYEKKARNKELQIVCKKVSVKSNHLDSF